MIWRALVGLAYVAFGVYLVAHPVIGVASLTLLLGSLFLVEGILDVALYFQLRALGAAGWFLLDGIVTLLLGLLIYLQWPSSSAWAGFTSRTWPSQASRTAFAARPGVDRYRTSLFMKLIRVIQSPIISSH